MACLYIVFDIQWKLKIDQTQMYDGIFAPHNQMRHLSVRTVLHAYNTFSSFYEPWLILFDYFVMCRTYSIFFTYPTEQTALSIKFDLISSSNYTVSISFDLKLIYEICCGINLCIFDTFIGVFFDSIIYHHAAQNPVHFIFMLFAYLSRKLWFFHSKIQFDYNRFRLRLVFSLRTI